MKKPFSVICLLIAAACSAVSCSKASAQTGAPGAQSGAEENLYALDAAALGGEWANDEAVKAAFTLDYRKQMPEDSAEYERVSLGTSPGNTGASQNQTVGGGIRKLSAYQTKYFNAAEEAARLAAIRKSQEDAAAQTVTPAAKADKLTVVDWGPQGEYSAQNQKPQIYVVFSQPMTALAALGETSAESPVVSITPKPKGVFRWYGTAFLTFEGNEPLAPQQTYTIKVGAGAKSVYGNTITGNTEFKFNTEPLQFLSIAAGEDFKKQNPAFYFRDSDVPPAAARFVSLNFNYPVSADDLREFIEIKEDSTPRRFKLTQAGNNGQKLLAEIEGAVDFNKTVTVTLKKGAKSKAATRGTEADSSRSFKTPGNFFVSGINRRSSYGRYRNIVDIEFSYALDERSVTPSVLKTNPPMQITAENIEVWGGTLRLSNLPVGYGAVFTLTVAGSVKDRYGRSLGAERTETITVPNEPPPEGEASFLNEWRDMVMLEAQFPPRYLFMYKNIAEGSWYSVEKRKSPFVERLRPGQAGWDSAEKQALAPGAPNAKYFADIDLKPYLTPANGMSTGFIVFKADLNMLPKLESPRRDGRLYDYEYDQTAVQVTDLGISARFGFNRVAVLVTSLSTGKPVEGAEVRLISPDEIYKGADIDAMPFWAGGMLTDANGLATAALSAGDFRSKNGNRHERPYIYAKKGEDRAVFTPSSHNMWRSSVYTQSPMRAERVKPVVFMFTDRGLYKPGETVTFRGVDRSQVLGNYAVYKGRYEAALMEAGWDGEVLGKQDAQTSEAGGFWGTFTIAPETEPGQYRLVYRRIGIPEDDDGESEFLAEVPVTVAFFERLKFQAEITRPALALVSGDDISATLKAAYLSGGSLSGARYDASWYREISYFHPETKETRGFVFGPRRGGDGRSYVASGGGALSGEGQAALNQKTGDESVKGAPYRYTVEANVTDISNQQISSSYSTLVHPARVYVGIRRAMSSGFAKAGQESAFEFIAVNMDGERQKDASLFIRTGADAGTLTATLYREDWRKIQQSGVNGYVYNEYVQEEVVDSTQKIKVGSGGGTFKLKPSQSGYHILRVTAQDRDGKQTLTEFTFYVTGAGGGWWNSGGAEEIHLVPDRSLYNPGDTAVIMMQSEMPAGSYLITVEREGIFTQEVRHFDAPLAEIEVPIARNFVPVVYVSVSSYSTRKGPPSHEYGQPDLDKPKGYFGVCKLFVDPRVRSFSVQIDTGGKTSFRPGEEVAVTLTATRGGAPVKNAELTLMAVDRGVLDLINYHVPNPIDYFYNESRFPLSVYGGDSRALLMDPVTYSVKNLQGGEGDDSKIDERADFNPTAVFEPELITDENGTVKTKFKLPDTLTTYRVTVFGMFGDIFSLKESEIAAQNVLNVREVLPRRLRERDTAEAGVLVTNLDSKPHKVTVNVKAVAGARARKNGEADDTGIRKAAGFAFIDGQNERDVTVPPFSNAMLYFDIAAVKPGCITLEWTIKSDVLNERLVNELEIERPVVMEAVTTTGSVGAKEKGRLASATEALVIPSWADQNTGSLSVTLDATRLAELDAAVNYLFHYPYGCMEQQSAAVLPLVIFGEYIDALSLKSEVENPRKVVEGKLNDWEKAQLRDGGFPYWPNGSRADFYVSLRIAHLLAAAKDKGYKIPSQKMINNLLNYLEKEYREAKRWPANSYRYNYRNYYAAYALYVFALHGRELDTPYLAVLAGKTNADASALALAGLTYLKLGKKREAGDAAKVLRPLLRQTTRGVDIAQPQGAAENYYWSFFGSQSEQLALTLEFFVQQLPGDDINTRILSTLLSTRKASGGYWSNTATTVRVLSAIDALIKTEKLDRKSTRLNSSH
jgi:uncharacterized protein YfaS (alpha-2-macroglobulin family)